MPKRPYYSVRTFQGELGRLWLIHRGSSVINENWHNTKIHFNQHDEVDDWAFWFERAGRGIEEGRIGPFQKNEVKEVSYEIDGVACTWGECYHIVIVLLSGTIELNYKPPLHSRSVCGNKFFRRVWNVRHQEGFNYVRHFSHF
jgi:hypothetical protein